MNLNPESKVLLQGFAQPLFAAQVGQMQAYGTNIVAEVSPGQGGLHCLDAIPVFDLVEQAVEVVGEIDITIIAIPPYRVLDAALEAMAANIRQIIIVSGGVPPLDMVQLLRQAESTGTLVLGPNSSGIIVPSKMLLGMHVKEFYTPGAIGIVSRSTTLTYEVARELTYAGLGQSIGVSLGSEAIAGSTFVQWLQILNQDKTTQVIVLIGQPGGGMEETAARYIAEAMDKPVIAYIAGCQAPIEKNWGNAGTLADVVRRQTDVGTAQSKLAALQQVNVPLAARPSEIPKLVARVLKTK